MTRKNKPASPLGKTLTLKYGTVTITGFEGGRRVQVYRPFEPIAREPWNNRVIERPMCLDHLDATPTVNTYAHQLGDRADYARAFDARCSCCYLGISHTTAKHDAAIGASSSAVAS